MTLLLPLLIRASVCIAVALVVVSAALLALAAASATGAQTSDAQALQSVADIPPKMLALYQQAGEQHGVDWAVLAAIGKVETNHARSTQPGVKSGVNAHGCCAGPMQFSIAPKANTWAAYAIDANRDGKIDVYDTADAIPTAAIYLKAHGAPENYERAVYAYNHSYKYVRNVLSIAASYRAQPTLVGATGQQILASERILLTASHRRDIEQGLIDPRVLALLAYAAQQHTVTVTSLKSDHSRLTVDGSVSNHARGAAVDIGAVNGEPCTGTRQGACGLLAVQFATLSGPFASTELIYCFDPDAQGPAFSRADHCDHIHAGYRS